MGQGKFFWVPLTLGLLVLVLSLAVAIWKVSEGRREPVASQDVRSQEVAPLGSMSLSPTGGEWPFVKGKAYTVVVGVDSVGRSVDGIDVLVSFDPKKAQVVEKTVVTTTVFERFPLNVVDNALGQVRFSALTFDPKPVSGAVASFSFKPVAAGEVDFSFDFKKGSTTDSNMADHETTKDILGSVVNAKYTFK